MILLLKRSYKIMLWVLIKNLITIEMPYIKKYIYLMAVTYSLLIIAAPLRADIYGILDEDGYWRFSNFSSDNIKKYDSLIQQASGRFGVEPSFIKAIIKAESDFNYKAISRKGAQGLMQLMPKTADAMKVNDPLSPKENIVGGTRYISLLLERFNDNKTLALAAYNAGPEMVESYQGVPPFQETKVFIQRVLNYYKKYSSRY